MGTPRFALGFQGTADVRRSTLPMVVVYTVHVEHRAHGKYPQAPPHPAAFLAKLSSPELALGSHKFPPHHSPSSLLLPTSPEKPVPR